MMQNNDDLSSLKEEAKVVIVFREVVLLVGIIDYKCKT